MGIAKKSIIDYFAQNAALVITFIAGILLSRFFGKEGYGEYSLILLANLMLVLFTNLGVEISTRVFSGKNRERIPGIHTASVLLILLISVLIGIVLFFFHEPLRERYFSDVRPSLLLLAVILVPFSLYQLVWQGIMVGLGEIAMYARFFMWNRIAHGGAVIVLIAFFFPSMELIVYIWFGIQIATFIISVIVLARKHRLIGKLDSKWLKELLKFGWVVHMGNIAANLIHKYNFLIISNLLGKGGVGLYSRAATFSDKITLIAGSLERATYEPAARADKDYAPILIQKVFRYNLYVNIAGAVAMYIFGSLCIHLLLQEEFLESLFPLKFLLVSVIFMSCSRILAVYFTAHLKKPHIPGIINWIVLPVSLTLCYLYTYAWGLKGASIAIACAYFFHAFLFFMRFVKRNPQVGIARFFLFEKDDWRNIKNILFRKRKPAVESQREQNSNR